MSDPMKVYVAAPYPRALFIRETVHPALRAAGFVPTSIWAEEAIPETGPDGTLIVRDACASMGLEATRQAWKTNRRSLAQSDVMLVCAFENEGGEMFAEVEQARFMPMPIYWTGRLTLSAFDVHVRVREVGSIQGITRAIQMMRSYAQSLLELRSPTPIRRGR